MTPIKEQIEYAAAKYADRQNNCYTNDFYGFIAGVEWALQQLPKWISVEERLPEPVLVGSGISVDVIMASDEYIIGRGYYRFNSGGWYYCNNDSELLLNVTHWMPLPQPPQQ